MGTFGEMELVFPSNPYAGWSPAFPGSVQTPACWWEGQNEFWFCLLNSLYLNPSHSGGFFFSSSSHSGDSEQVAEPAGAHPRQPIQDAGMQKDGFQSPGAAFLTTSPRGCSAAGTCFPCKKWMRKQALVFVFKQGASVCLPDCVALM